MSLKRAILIAGPTASGKSEVASAVARALGGVIINADSMQVHEGLDVLVSKPSRADQRDIPHALYSVVPRGGRFSVADWLKAARKEAEEAWAAGRIPVFTGGTGLYFKALLEGLAEIPEIPKETRAALGERLAREGVAALHKDLAAKDPESAARLTPGDRQRIVRALEVVTATGVTLSEWHRRGREIPFPGGAFVKVCLTCETDRLNERIRARFERMVAGGALMEVADFLERAGDEAPPAPKALGVGPLARHLRGEIPLTQAVELAVIETRRYAKRQRTWFRNQFRDWNFVEAGPGAPGEIVSLAEKAFRE